MIVVSKRVGALIMPLVNNQFQNFTLNPLQCDEAPIMNSVPDIATSLFAVSPPLVFSPSFTVLEHLHRINSD